jgi:hypothetical protein
MFNKLELCGGNLPFLQAPHHVAAPVDSHYFTLTHQRTNILWYDDVKNCMLVSQ